MNEISSDATSENPPHRGKKPLRKRLPGAKPPSASTKLLSDSRNTRKEVLDCAQMAIEEAKMKRKPQAKQPLLGGPKSQQLDLISLNTTTPGKASL